MIQARGLGPGLWKAREEHRAAECGNKVEKMRVQVANRGSQRTGEKSKSGIKKRTAELLDANAELRKRVAAGKRAEEALARKITELHSFINNIPDLAWVKDANSRFVAVNKAFADAVGMAPELLINHTCEVCFGKEGARKFRADDRKVMRGGKQVAIEERILDARKKEVWLETIKSPILDHSGRAVGTVGVARDITGRKKSEEALRESERKYKELYRMVRLMADNVPDLIWAKDLENRFIFVNRAMCEKFLHVRNPDEPIGKTDMFFAEREGQKRPNQPDWHTFGEICTNSDATVMRNKNAQRFEEFGNVRGKFLFLDVHKAPFWDEQGRMIGTVGCGRDVTREKKLEGEYRKAAEALRESEKRYQSVFEHSGTATVIIEDDMMISMVNAEYEKLTGYSREEIIGKKKWTHFTHPEDIARMKEYHDNRRHEGGEAPADYTFRLLDRQGNIKDVYIKVGMIPGTKQSIASLTDITAQKRNEEEIRQFPRRLITAVEEERKRISRDLHDEYGKTLTLLHFELDALKNSLSDPSGESRKRVDNLMDLTERQADSIRKIASDLRPAMLDDIGLLPTLKWYLQDLQNRFPDLRIDFRATGIKKRLQPEIEITIYRLIQEGLTNIVKHAGAGRAEILLTLSHPKIILVINDDGIGFDDRGGDFANGKRTRGIGLWGMQERVHSLGGVLWIRSAKKKGTTLRVELPVKEGK